MSRDAVEKQARYLAQENRRSNPDVREVYWFPDDQEVRLLELTEEIPISEDGKAHPFYFRPSPHDELPQSSGIVLIRPEEFGKLQLPDTWGGWQNARRIDEVLEAAK